MIIIAKKSNVPPSPQPVSVSSRGAACEGKTFNKNKSVDNSFFMVQLFNSYYVYIIPINVFYLNCKDEIVKTELLW